MYKPIYLILMLTFLFACSEEELSDIPIDPETGWFPETPVNITDLNTRFDEYNTNITGSGMNIHMYYSSNFEKKGANFDIQGAVLTIDIKEEQNKMSLNLSANKPANTEQLLPLINSEYDEYGPLSFSANFGTNWYFFYANNKAGQYDIEYTYQQGAGTGLKGPFSASVLNSNVCDFYPTINALQTQMVFSSYRGKKYDIYEIEIEDNDFIEWLNSGANSAVLNTNLSSSEDDKCPCIRGDLIVFASDRKGGYGGYDLWYSEFENGKWGIPVNFGPEINTEHDEFSPALEYYSESNNDIMLFSSNRPGGKGGYDFYFVGIPKMIR